MPEQQLQFQGNEAIPAAGPITTSSMRRTPTNALLTLAEAKASSSTLSSNPSPSVVLPKRGRTPGVNGVDTAEESGEGTEEGSDELGLYGNLKVWKQILPSQTMRLSRYERVCIHSHPCHIAC